MTDILKDILPALLVLITAYLLIDRLLRNDDKRRNFELHKANHATITPIRLRAYERIMLVLERTTPHQLIVNQAVAGMTNLELQTTLLSTIRQEFSHNLSQQIYISDELWHNIVSAQESLLQLVNACAANVNPTESAAILAETIIQTYHTSAQTPTQLAIEMLKEEVRTQFQ